MKKWKKFEEKTHEVVKNLNPKSEVYKNVFLKGKLSRGRRQVDVQLIDPSNYDFIAFECKDYKVPLDVPVIEAFNTKLLDIGAKKGSIVSNSSYTKTAINMATELGIDLLALVDTGDKDIRTKLFAPSMISDTMLKSMGLSFSTKASFSGSVSQDPKVLRLVVDNGETATVYEVIARLWNDKQLVQKSGSYVYTPNNQNQKQILTNEGEIVTLDTLNFRYDVVERHFVGNVDIINATGIYNVREKSFQTREIITENIAPYEKEKVWKEITPEEVKNTKITFGLVCTSLMPETLDFGEVK